MDQHQHVATAVPEIHEAGGGKKEVWRVTWILSILTIIELAIGFWMMGMQNGSGLYWACKVSIITLMMAKAFYIVGYFMHLKHEVRNLIMTIVVPLLLFVWFIIAFLADGNSYKNLRNTYDTHHKEMGTQKMEQQEHHEKEEGKHEEPKKTGAAD